MTGDVDHVIDLTSGHWRSKRECAADGHGVFDKVGDYPTHATELADRPDVDGEQGSRLRRALGPPGLLDETNGERFSLPSADALRQADSPGCMRAMARSEEGSTHHPENEWTGDVERVVG